jgi:hypothetical protein
MSVESMLDGIFIRLRWQIDTSGFRDAVVLVQPFTQINEFAALAAEGSPF